MALPPRLVIATHNAGKLEEFRRLFEPFDVELVSAGELGLPVPDEPLRTYRGNAGIKALAAMDHSGVPSLADDTGIEIDALGGRPGVDTAAFAERHGGWAGAREAIADRTGLRLGLVTVRATAVCALSFARSATSIVTAEYRVPGILRWPPTEAAPGFAAVFRPQEDVPFTRDGILLHRRRAFRRLIARV